MSRRSRRNNRPAVTVPVRPVNNEGRYLVRASVVAVVAAAAPPLLLRVALALLASRQQ